MAKSEDFPGQKKTQPLRVTGVRPPAEIAEPNLKVSVAEMLAAQRAQQEGSAPSSTMAIAPAPGRNDEPLPASDTGVLAEIKVDSIRVSPFQPRLTFSEAAIEDLANSIASVGLVKPLTVRPIGEGVYELIGGERRWRAHQLLGRETVTVYIRSVTDAMAKILALTDNEGQEALTEYERGRSYAAIMRAGEESSIRALARRVGVNHSIVSRCLLLMELPEEVREILDKSPGLIGGKWAKDFIEFSRTEPKLLLQAVTSMRDHQWTQEYALRWLAKEVAARDQRKTPSKFTDKEISGIGRVRVDGKKVELRCEKNVDAKRLAEQFSDFLKTIDRSLISKE
ncbi:chromosome partitioning protein ParB [Pseudomonas aeruginosa]|uniref:Plasmid partitioning protein ParB n=1 Tax=Pseudomonas aeruginosa TaxID=287 RepID=A0A6C0L6M1_PSEAI|nr:ParB/RepB/Spo0J family partition protein [Pseudomonas aeruginosa]QHU24574.1 plasmid partitioning protein ParB [Pseudomonas aeruginosa]QZH54313.1 ParB/RepB/Spo0J family partition protein [Pseudomonas aeruginosa]RUJ11783.1 ParB/RepB/Spo0J family partition protein [Pseudomonas aeruginosa]RUJ33844.1 ParB/RepB/Spo0J family partition protein [Pseudomonas aeruginosa]GLE84074.1 chromosome partitioning protein ParB [Pseudomonas aeruginosa]